MSETVAKLKAEFMGDTSQLKGAIKDVKSDLKSFGKEGTEASNNIGASFLRAAATIGSIMAALKTAKEVYDFSAEGAQIASLKMASYNLAKSYGANMNSIVNAVKEASFNTITDYDAMKSANLALTMGVSKNAKEISNLMEIAIQRGRAFGLTATESFDRIMRGIGRTSPKILDDLGFNMKGVTGQAEMLAAVLKQGNSELEKMGGLQVDLATGYGRIDTAWKQFWQDTKQSFGEGFSFLGLSKSERQRVLKEEGAMLFETAKNYKEYYKDFINMRNRLVGAGDRTIMPFTEAEYKKRQHLGTRSEARQIDDVTEAIKQQNTEFELQAGLAGIANENLNDYFYTMANAGDIQLSIDAQMNLAQSLGLIDEKSLVAAQAMQLLKERFDANADGMIDATEGAAGYNDAVSALLGNAEILMKDRNAVWSIRILMNGVAMPYNMLGIAHTRLTGQDYQKYYANKIGGQHGLHGIIPAGYPFDSFPIMAKSGERVDITPAGNGNKGGSGTSNTLRFYGPVTFQVSDMKSANLLEQLRV